MCQNKFIKERLFNPKLKEKHSILYIKDQFIRIKAICHGIKGKCLIYLAYIYIFLFKQILSEYLLENLKKLFKKLLSVKSCLKITRRYKRFLTGKLIKTT